MIFNDLISTRQGCQLGKCQMVFKNVGILKCEISHIWHF